MSFVDRCFAATVSAKKVYCAQVFLAAVLSVLFAGMAFAAAEEEAYAAVGAALGFFVGWFSPRTGIDNIVDKKNTRRVVHGLEICLQTGKPYSSFRKNSKKARSFNTKKIVLNLPREELYARINARVDKMMASGLLEEARSLYPLRDLNALNTVGYKELFEHFDGKYPLDEAVSRIKGNTRRYARKQLTWFRRDAEARWFSPNDKDSIMKFISEL